MFRQGDLLIVRRNSPIPATAVVRKDGVLLVGEATGHAHRVDPSHAQVMRCDDGLFLRVLHPTEITHEEHRPIPLDPGEYQVIRQREFREIGWGAIGD